MAQVTLTAEHLTKRYGGVVALADGSLQVSGGEVLALMGANGSGKSTLSKIITGLVAPDGGTLRLDGREARFRSPQEARRAGIGVVYQELSLIPDMTVAENIWLTHEPLGPAGMVSARTLRSRSAALLELFAGTTGPGLTPDALVAELSPDERQIVEILKALSLAPRLLILDEATSSLDSQQVARLFQLVADWKREGRATIFVSHRMDEVFHIGDRAVVLRSGATVGAARLAEISERELVQLMIGGEVAARSRRAGPPANGAPLLTAEGLTSRRLRGVRLTLRPGELLGLGGLQGQGQSELLLALFGAIPFSGQVALDRRPVHFTSPRQAIRAGIAFVPGDRGREGLLPSRSILENLQLPSWRRYGLPLRMQAARTDAAAVGKELRLVAASLDAPATSLSGGNAQKVVVGKWLLRKPRVLLLDDPTKGVDVGAKGELYALLDELRTTGTGIILYSSDDEELLALADRILVLQDGHVRAELAGQERTRAALVAASMGAAHTASAGREDDHG